AYTPSIYVKASAVDTPKKFSIGVGSSGTSVSISSTEWTRVEYPYFTASTTTHIPFFRNDQTTYGDVYIWAPSMVVGALSAGNYIPTDAPIITPNSGMIVNGVNNIVNGNLALGIDNATAPIDMLGSINGASLPTPWAITAGTPTSGGAVNAGTHSYKVTFVNAYGESLPSPASNIITTATNKKVPLTLIPIGRSGTTARKIYRTVAGNTGDYKLVTTITNNTDTTYLDVLADASLGASAPTVERSGGLKISTQGITALTIDSLQRLGIGTITPTELLDVAQNGIIRGNFTTNGTINTNKNFSINGINGITASGTSCTITAITGGIITGATCV
ncbi:MAG: hypothetical protein WCK90_05410, partial [archaeon]